MAVQAANYKNVDQITEGIKKTYNASSGCDIVATLDGILLGNLNGLSFSTTREKAPIYVMGSSDAVSFGRGKRGHAGSLIFTNFDRHALYDIMEGSLTQATSNDRKRYWYWAKTTDIPAGGRSKLLAGSDPLGALGTLGVEKKSPNYSDQIPPFTISLTSMNEYGNVSVMHILGVELINEGSGVSIDDIVTETQMTFVARAIIGWRPLLNANSQVDSWTVGANAGANILERLNNLTAVRQVADFESIQNSESSSVTV